MVTMNIIHTFFKIVISIVEKRGVVLDLITLHLISTVKTELLGITIIIETDN